jgi:signal transduction histidine kinase
MPSPKAVFRQLLKILLLQQDRERSERIVAQLWEAGFEVDAEVVETQAAFEERLRSGSYDLAINGFQLASRVINDILDLSRIEAGRIDLRPEVFAMTGAVEEVMATIRPQAVANGVQLEGPFTPDIALRADRT